MFCDPPTGQRLADAPTRHHVRSLSRNSPRTTARTIHGRRTGSARIELMGLSQDDQMTCACCDTALVLSPLPPFPGCDRRIDIEATCARLDERVEQGRMSLIRSDCALLEMPELLGFDVKFTIAAFLHCHVCGRVLFWGLCVRGGPIYKHDGSDAPTHWPWDSDWVSDQGRATWEAR